MGMIHYVNILTPWHWIGLAIFFLILEFIVAASGFLIWLALLATVVGLLLWLFPQIPWPYQLLIFSLGGIICSVSWWAFLLHHPSQAKIRQQLAHQYLDRELVLETPIRRGRGTIHIDSLAYSIKGPDLPAGASVRVVGVSKITLRVEKINKLL